MRVETQTSDREVLAGLVERVTYQNADNGFCVVRVKARGHRDLVTLVGHAPSISAGEWITATGGWVNDPAVAAAERRRHGTFTESRLTEAGAVGAAVMAGLAAGALPAPAAGDVPRWAGGRPTSEPVPHSPPGGAARPDRLTRSSSSTSSRRTHG